MPNFNSFHRLFGRYVLLDKIAEGGMAQIYRAVAHFDGVFRLVAIKLILASKTDDQSYREMFRSEIKLMSQLAHQNVVQIYDYGEENGVFFIAMEYIRGKSLHKLFSDSKKHGQPLPRRLCLYVIEQAAQGLEYIHSFKDPITGQKNGIVHRDVSPHNIMFSYDGIPKLIDFGMAKAKTSHDLTETGVIKGKIPYLAPELLHSVKPSPQSDIFALGTVFWEILVGQRLFNGDGINDYSVLQSIDRCNESVKRPRTLNPKISPEVDEVVMKCLQKDPALRFNSCEELSTEVKRIMAKEFPETGTTLARKFICKSYESDMLEENQRISQLVEEAKTVLDGRGTNSGPTHIVPPAPPVRSTDGSGSGSISATNLSVADIQKILITENEKQRKTTTRTLLIGAVFAVCVIIGAFFVFYMQLRSNTRPMAAGHGLVILPTGIPGEIVLRQNGVIVTSAPLSAASLEISEGQYQASIYNWIENKADHRELTVRSGKTVDIQPRYSERNPANVDGQIAGTLLWIDSSQPPSETYSKIRSRSEHPSLSANQSLLNSQVPLAENVLNGQPGFDFSKKDSWYEIDSLSPFLKKATSLSLVYVVRLADPRKKQYVFSCHGGDKLFDVMRSGFTSSGKIDLLWGGNQQMSFNPPVPPDQVALYSILLSPNRMMTFVNGVLSEEESAVKLNLRKTEYCSIGQEWDQQYPSDYFRGFLGELMVFDHTLSNVERVEIEQRLAAKFKIAYRNNDVKSAE